MANLPAIRPRKQKFDKPTKIYDVIVNGFSIGQTFQLKKAADWHSKAQGLNRFIREVPYTEPQHLAFALDYSS